MLSGVSGREVWTIPASQQLIIQGPFMVNIHVGKRPAGQVTIHGDSALVNNVGYRYQGEAIQLSMNPNLLYPQQASVWLDINVPVLTRLQVSQGAQVTVVSLNNLYFQALVQDNSRLVLFGVARRLDLTAMNFAAIDAKQIKSRTGFVNTNQYAQASVLTSGGLSAWARDQSNIYYYTDPLMVAPYLDLSGSVLRMSGIAS